MRDGHKKKKLDETALKMDDMTKNFDDDAKAKVKEYCNMINGITERYSHDELGFIQQIWDKITELLSYIINIEWRISDKALLERKCGSFVDLIKSQQQEGLRTVA